MTPIEAAAREMSRQRYYRAHHQPCREVEGYVDGDWREYVPDVIAVLQAIREPSNLMVVADPTGPSGSFFPEDIWRAMIDAAIADGPTEGN